MTWFRVLRARLFALTHKDRVEREMEEELRFHLAKRVEENIRLGMPPADAIREARRQFGNLNRVKDKWRDVVGAGALEAFSQDVRFAVRMLGKDRTFTAVSLLALTLSIGANTALFTLTDSVLLQPLPYAAPERIMAIWSSGTRNPGARYNLCYPDFLDFQSGNHSFEALAAFYSTGMVVAGGGGEPKHVQGTTVTANLFSLLGVSPILGRTFSPREDAAGNRVAIISDELWESRFGRSAALDQLSLEIKGIEYRVIGVMPPDFRFPIQNETTQLWITFSGDLEPFPNGASPVITTRNVRYLEVLGRLKHDVTAKEAEEDLRAIADGLAKSLPETNRRTDSCVVMPMLADITSNIRPALILLMGAGGSVLGLTCVNLANLLLARGSTRQKEVAVRRALGAGRGRILRQLLTESLVLGLFGGAAGLLLGLVAIRGIVFMLPDNFPRAADIAAGIRAVGFTALIAVLTSCFFGFAPAWGSSHCALAPILNEPSREASATRKTRRLRSSFVVIEMVLAFILLFAACLLLRNLWQLWHTPLGFNPSNLLTANLSLPDSRETAVLDRWAAFYRELQARISRLEEVEAAAVVSRMPLTEQAFTGFEVPGRPKDKGTLPSAYSIVVTPNYFRTMGIAVLKGREFDERDERHASPTVIVNDTLARLAFGGEDPLGKRIRPRVTDDVLHGPQEREIIGVVADVKMSNLTAVPLPAVYLPHSQCAFNDMTLVVRSNSRSEAVFDSLQETVAQMDPSLPLFQRRKMGDNIVALVAQPRLNSMVLSAFALIATLLTAVGVYGSMAYSVAQRTHEIGIRLALGAQKVAIFRLVVGEGMRLTGWSLVGGTLCSVIVARLLEKVAYSGSPGSSSTMPILTLVAALVFVVALIACWFPAQRASAVDPLHAIGQR